MKEKSASKKSVKLCVAKVDTELQRNSKQALTCLKKEPFRFILMNKRPDRELISEADWSEFINKGLRTWFELEPVRQQAKFADDIDSFHAALFDEYIIFQAATLGCRIRLGHDVRARTLIWEGQSNGPDKFERLGKAEAKATRIFRVNCVRQ